MTGKKRVVLAALLLGAAASTTILIAYTREPRYGGHTLSYWILEYDQRNSAWYGARANSPEDERKAAEAIRAMGPAAVPFLTEWVTYKTGSIHARFIDIMHNLHRGWLGRLVPKRFTVDHASARVSPAAQAFSALGPAGKSAVPRLLQEAVTKELPRNSNYAIKALTGIGDEGFAALNTVLTNELAEAESRPSFDARTIIAAAVSHWTNALPILPGLKACNESAQSELQGLARRATIAIQLQAAEAIGVPHEGQLVNGIPPRTETGPPAKELYIRELATNILLQIAPHMLTNTPAQQHAAANYGAPNPQIRVHLWESVVDELRPQFPIAQIPARVESASLL